MLGVVQLQHQPGYINMLLINSRRPYTQGHETRKVWPKSDSLEYSLAFSHNSYSYPLTLLVLYCCTGSNTQRRQRALLSWQSASATRTPTGLPLANPSQLSPEPTIHTCARRGGGESCLWCLVRLSLHSPTLPSSLRFAAAAPRQRIPPKEMLARRGLSPCGP